MVKLKVAVLNLYIAKRKLKHSKGALKREKVDIVTTDIVRSLYSDSHDDASDDNIDEYHDSDDDEEDIVGQQIWSDDDIEDDEDEEDNEDPNCEGTDIEQENISDFLQITRSGRVCRTWIGRARISNFA